MLQIRLRKASKEGKSVTVACPDHLVLAELPVAKSLGLASATTSLIKNVGRRSHRQPGEQVHFCICCDFPIAIYGRLSPCQHAFCLDCARSDPLCYLCDERIHKIQTIKVMEGIFICAAPRCFKSFVNQAEFLSHVKDSHPNPNPNPIMGKKALKSHSHHHIHHHPKSAGHSRPLSASHDGNLFSQQQAFSAYFGLQQDSVPMSNANHVNVK